MNKTNIGRLGRIISFFGAMIAGNAVGRESVLLFFLGLCIVIVGIVLNEIGLRQ